MYCVDIAFKMRTSRAKICIKLYFKLEHSSSRTIQMIQRPQLWGSGDWQLHHNNMPAHASCIMSHAVFWPNIKSPRWLSLPTGLVPCDFWFFPKLKSPLKGKRFQTVDEVPEKMTGQLMAIVRTLWGPKVPTLKGTEASLSYVQYFLYLFLLHKCFYFSYYMAEYILHRLYLINIFFNLNILHVAITYFFIDLLVDVLHIRS